LTKHLRRPHHLTETIHAQLVDAAVAAREKAYAPYSHYRVGAALLTAGGAVYTGCNVENATYGATICAERTAIVKAVSEGERDFLAIAVATEDGGTPCGICRQVLHEFAPEIWVIMVNLEGRVVRECALSALLPAAFGPESLESVPALTKTEQP
jgi:cytidine deaminase